MGSCLFTTGKEKFQRSLLDKSFSLTSLNAHTEQKKHRVRGKAGNDQQQDAENTRG